MLYNNEIQALSATIHCPETPKLVAWKIGGVSSTHSPPGTLPDNCDDDNDHQIIMEFIQTWKMEQGHRLPAQITATIAYFVLRALKSLHNADFLHRDIKPENILVSRDGIVKLCDFGICEKKQSLLSSPSAAFRGTPLYMAPEVISNGSESIDVKNDIWGFGITILQWLTGSNPIAAFPESEISQSLAPKKFLMEESGNLFQQINATHGQDCADFLRKCIADLADRHSAEELLNHKWIVDNINHSSDVDLRKRISTYISTLELKPSVPDF
eukprot:CAMPEP_0117450738 /NCGR_PEP_ID=MMETSP0759-20121206/8630_1 /TAXON_ID=63605 /ORGANISM="Percolomonas cosmopolitus, Strain WS" /LENGTH=269 /DNA_ID=CAMNT_0005243283 /DNA_START=670 /DNA_END=1479 /DNA_ORIENTATION=-